MLKTMNYSYTYIVFSIASLFKCIYLYVLLK